MSLPSTLNFGFKRPYGQPYQLGYGSYVAQNQNKDQNKEGSALRVVYYNDPHEKFAAMPHMVTGFRYQSFLGQRRGQDVLRLSGGDNNIGKEGKEWFLNVGLMNLLQLHGTALGNHELDQGSQSFSRGMLRANFPTLLANMEIPRQSSFAKLVQRGKIQTRHQIVNGRYASYGLIGVTTPDLDKVLSSHVDIEGVDEKTFEETCRIVQNEVNALLLQGINRIVLTSHMGYKLEKALAKRVSGIDVIVGGHSHDVLRGARAEGSVNNPFDLNEKRSKANWIRSPIGEPVMIVQAGKDGRLFGTLDLNFNLQGQISGVKNQLHRVFDYKSDPESLVLLERALGPPKKLAEISTDYANEFIPFQEDAVAEFTADAVREMSGADIAFIRSAEIRNDIHPGVFTDLDLKALMPFSDTIVRLDLTGAEILGALKHSAKGLQERNAHPGMLHPSGMALTFNERTGEIVSAYVQIKNSENSETEGKWEALEMDKTYSVATGRFNVTNKGELPELYHPERIYWDSGKTFRQIFHWGLQQAGAPVFPVAFQKDGRFQIINA